MFKSKLQSTNDRTKCSIFNFKKSNYSLFIAWNPINFHLRSEKFIQCVIKLITPFPFSFSILFPFPSQVVSDRTFPLNAWCILTIHLILLLPLLLHLLLLLLQFFNRCIYIVFSAFYTIIHCFYSNRRCQYSWFLQWNFSSWIFCRRSLFFSQQLINLSYRWFIEARHLLAKIHFMAGRRDRLLYCILITSLFIFIFLYSIPHFTSNSAHSATYCSCRTLFLLCASSIVSWFWSASFYNIKYKCEERTQQDEAGEGRKRKLRKFNTLMERLRALVWYKW